jgi:EAL and modified HD-GYP domain-containing signal transduction protein
LSFSGVGSSNASPKLFQLAEYCKFDYAETDEDDRRLMIAQNPSVKFIAGEVDTLSAFENAAKQKYALFQGNFFKQPSLVKKTKEFDPLRANYLRLLKLTSTEDYVDFNEISNVISSDVALSYKLLHLLNSAAVGLRNRISSISMAVAYLGEVNLKQWIAMLALRGISDDKPMELIRVSMIRAQFGENLCQAMTPKRDAKHVFLVGLLSLLDVALEQSKEEVFQEIPVADEIRDSLLTSTGPYSDLVKFYTDYEHANWEEVSAFAVANRLTDSQINNAYITSVKWYNDIAELEG